MAQSSRQDGAWSGLRVIAVLLVLASSAAAQTTSTIEGTVSDASGAVLPGAEVNVRGETISAERRATTDAKGFYRVTALPAGTYTVTVTFSGLSPNAATLDVTLNRVVTFDVTMQVGGVQETVAVSVPALDPSTSATATTITPREIAELPVNGRNYLDLLQLVPGVAINRQVDPEYRSIESRYSASVAATTISCSTASRTRTPSTAGRRSSSTRKPSPSSRC